MSDPPVDSWILEIRRLLQERPTSRRDESGSRVVVLVGLTVVDRALHVVLVEEDSPDPEGAPGLLRFPSRQLAEDGEPWQVAASVARSDLELDPGDVLILGELDERSTLGDFLVLPCVAAVPASVLALEHVRGLELKAVAGQARSALQSVRLADRNVELEIVTVDDLSFWGPVAEVLFDLASRFGLEAG